MNKIKILIQRSFNGKNGVVAGMTLTILLVCTLSISFAFFTASAERKGALNIVSGNLYSLITSADLNDNKEILVSEGSTRTIKVKLTNVNGVEAKFNFYYTSNNNDIEIGYTNTGDKCPKIDGIILNPNGAEGDSQNYTIQIINKSESPATITFGTDVGLSNKTLSFPSGKNIIPALVCTNEILTINGLPVNKCEDVEYNAETADKNAMFTFTHEDTEQTKSTTSYRYIGSDPHNYVTFNGEIAGWRIIGLFNDENKDGVKAQRLKLIREERLNDTNYSWDETNSNNWMRPSGINTALNSNYYSSTAGNCPLGGTTTGCDFTTNGLKNSQTYIENMKWYLGTGLSDSNRSTDNFYSLERGNNGQSDIVWDGNVGLIYSSDYGYTFGKGVNIPCFNTPSNSEVCDATKATSSWMYKNTYNFWTMTSQSEGTSKVFDINTSGYIDNQDANYTEASVRPVIYLKSNVKITSGTGTKEDPYQLGI